MTSPDGLLTLKPEESGPPDARQRFWRRIQALVLILFCLEIGIVLLLFPWSTLWDNNYFFSLSPRWAGWFSSSYVRGAVSGLGIVNLWIALSEAWRLRSA